MRIRRMVKLICLLLVFALLSGCGAQNVTHYFAETEFGKTRYADMKYERYDKTHFDELTAKLNAASASGSGEEMIKLYDEIVAETEKALTMNSLININYSQNPNDENIISEKDKSLDITMDIADEANKAIRDALLSPAGAGLRKHLSVEEVREFLSYEDLTDRQKELLSENNELVTEYERLILNFDVSANIDGEIWTLDKLQEQAQTMDEDRAAQIYNEIEKNVNLQAGGIMQELLTIRIELAKSADYDSFVDYEYVEDFYRDYTKEEAAIFENAVKTSVAPRYFGELSKDVRLMTAGSDCKITAANVEDFIGKYAPQISSEIYDSFQYMKKYGLGVFTSDAEKLDQGYTTELYSYDTPFIYNMCYDNNAKTLSDSVHEFGHFTAMHYMPTDNVLTSSTNCDIAEVNSQGLELLYDAYYDEIFGKDAPLIRAQHLFALLSSVIEGCIQDEFQQYLYSHPEISMDEMNKAYCAIRASYGDKPEDGIDYDYNWMYVMHTFNAPMYYISYATSALTALDIWTRAQSDRGDAVNKYLYFTSFGSEDYGYLELLDICGLENFTDANYIKSTAGKVMDTIDELCENEKAA